MPFDMGWNFRATSGYVTDQAYAVPQLAESYPHTYTNANGDSINAGWGTGSAANKVDRSNTNDPRLAGIGFTSSPNFVIDLSSGSAPGAGTYTVDLAAGDQGGTQTIGLLVKDDATAFITIPSQSVGAGHFLDATVTDVTASTTWTGTTVSRAFASTTCTIAQNGAAIFLAHFRLTLAGPTAYTLTADSGSFSLGGQAATLLWAHLLDAAVGVYTLSGQDAVLAAGRLIAADAGLYTLAGQDATLALGHVLGAEAGSFTLAGQDATFARAYAILAEAGFFTLDGQDVDFAKLTHYLLTADPGLFALAGQGVTLRYSGAVTGRQRRDTMQPFRRRWSA